MTPQESLDFFATQISRSAKGFEVAKSSHNLQLAALNVRQMFKGHLMCGLIQWQQREHPANHFEEATTLVVEAIRLLPQWEPSFDVGFGLPLARAAILAGLINVPFDVAAFQMSALPADIQLDYLLATTSPSPSVKDSAMSLLKELRQDKRTALAADSYENYFDILSAAGNSTVLGDFLRKGDTLFNKRARDSFFSGGDQTEGGGPDNSLVVDYRLAFALKRAAYSSDSMHAWIW